MLTKYEHIEKVASGSFGAIYSAIHKRTHEKVAIKVEKRGINSSLKHEARVYNLLKGSSGVPRMIWFGRDVLHSYIILPFLENNLKQNKAEQWTNTFHEQVIITIGKQILHILKGVHKKEVVHCDIKPENFMYDDSGFLHLIDFGFTRKFNLIPKQLKKPVGTPNFMSRKVHSGTEPGYNDDLESVLYILLWCGKKETLWDESDDDPNNILRQKELLFKELDKIPHYLRDFAESLKIADRYKEPNYNLI